MLKDKLSAFALALGVVSASAVTGCGGGGGAPPPPPPPVWVYMDSTDLGSTFVPDKLTSKTTITPVTKEVTRTVTKEQTVVVTDCDWVPTSKWKMTETLGATEDVVVGTLSLGTGIVQSASLRPSGQSQRLASFSSGGRVTLAASRITRTLSEMAAPSMARVSKAEDVVTAVADLPTQPAEVVTPPTSQQAQPGKTGNNPASAAGEPQGKSEPQGQTESQGQSADPLSVTIEKKMKKKPFDDMIDKVNVTLRNSSDHEVKGKLIVSFTKNGHKAGSARKDFSISRNKSKTIKVEPFLWADEAVARVKMDEND